jgi:hypothetical protein
LHWPELRTLKTSHSETAKCLSTSQALKKISVQQMNDLRSCPGPLPRPSEKNSTFILPLTSAPFNGVTEGKGAPGHGGREPLRDLRGHLGPCPFRTSSSSPPPTQPQISPTQRFPGTKLYAVPPLPPPPPSRECGTAAQRPSRPRTRHGGGRGPRPAPLGVWISGRLPGDPNRSSFPLFPVPPPFFNCPRSLHIVPPGSLGQGGS